MFYLTILAHRVRDFELALNMPLPRRNFGIVNRRYLSEEKAPFAMELKIEVKQPLDPRDLKRFASLMPEGVDAVWQSEILRKTPKKLAVFDMDSTLIAAEVIDEIAKHAGVGEKVAAITARAMAGELDFDGSLRERVALLKGLSSQILDEVSESITVMDGAVKLLKALRRTGCRTILASGGFDVIAQTLKANKELELDHIVANRLEISQGHFTGRVLEPIVNAKAKEQTLLDFMRQEQCSREAVLAVGDGANDIPMLQAAGLGIAFHAKPKTKQEVFVNLNQPTLLGILYLLGFADYEVETLCR